MKNSKTMAKNENSITKNGTELIVYQIGELKAMFVDFKNAMDKIDKRVSALEIWQAGELQRIKEETKGEDKASDLLGRLDLTKIILGIIALAASAIALASLAVQGGVVK